MIAVAVGTTATALVVVVGTRWAQPAARRTARDTAPVDRRRGTHPMVELLERISREVRSGAAMRTALVDALEQDHDAFPVLRERLSRGGSVLAALDDVSTHSPDERMVVHALQLTAATGGGTADTLDRVVSVLRERQAWRDERHAQAASARLSARMMTVLPIAVALWGVASGPRVREVYASSPAAAVATAVGVGLNLLGWWWMRRLVRGPEAR